MPDASRSLPTRPSLRYLQLEARRRRSAGEFPALHDAQAAIAREYGQPSWAALRQLISAPPPQEEGHALAQLKWVIARFRDAGSPGWAPPGDAELAEHFDDRFLAALPAGALITSIAGVAADLREDLTVVGQRPLEAHIRVGGLDVFASAAADPPHRLTALQAVPAPARITDPRVAAPPPARTEGAVPAGLTGVAGEAFAELGLPALALAGGEPGGAGWVIAQGWADLERAELLAPGHRFPVTGATALVTATAVLRLVADGALALDASANDHLRTVRLADDTITVRELLSHTAGVNSPAAADMMTDSVTELVTLTGPVLAADGPRGAVQPSNGGYAALGQLIADVTGLPYASAVTRLILEPLGMRGSSFPARPADIGPGAVTGYSATRGGALAPAGEMISALPAAGGLWAPPADLARLAAGWSALLPAALADEALTPQAGAGPGQPAAGLGWIISPRGDIALHAGAQAGATAAVLVRIRDRHARVIMTSIATSLDPVNERVLRAWGASS
jgi:CubicO group peptidase (beta-lactamase class C family)